MKKFLTLALAAVMTLSLLAGCGGNNSAASGSGSAAPAGGDLIYADGATQQSVGIPAGGKMMVRFFVDKAFVEQWRSYQALPASARVSASFRVDED